jgi:hypothetical protein
MDTSLHVMLKDRLHNKVQHMREDLGDNITIAVVQSALEASPLKRRAEQGERPEEALADAKQDC